MGHTAPAAVFLKRYENLNFLFKNFSSSNWIFLIEFFSEFSLHLRKNFKKVLKIIFVRGIVLALYGPVWYL